MDTPTEQRGESGPPMSLSPHTACCAASHSPSARLSSFIQNTHRPDPEDSEGAEDRCLLGDVSLQLCPSVVLGTPCLPQRHV